MNNKKFDFNYWLGSIRAALVPWLKKQSVKLILKKLMIAGGLKGWLIGFVVGELIDEADEYLIEPAFRKVGYIKEVYDGTKSYKKMANAQDIDDWRDSVRDM